MPTRRDFLQSALLLPAALTTGNAFTQDTPKTDAAQVFADFEGGNYDGWTIEGDAFGTAPTTDALFPGKIRGFTGRGFVCSLHPKKGNAATGKAISQEFTIEKPFLTFRIGGGSHPNQACLNLIVDGRTVRTATGDGTASLSESCFDVSEFLGRKAHIEVVDATASADRGDIMADDITLTDKIKYKGYGWRDKMIEPFFITRAKVWQGTDFRNGESPFPFELSESDIQRAIDRVVVAMHDPDMTLPPVAERNVERIGAQIVRKVDATIAALGLPKVNKFTREWLIAEGVCEWVRLTVCYDHILAHDPGMENYKYVLSQSATIFGMTSPKGECWGIATAVRDLARASGLKCDMVRGFIMDFGFERSSIKQSNHSWVCFIVDGKIEVPSDVSAARTASELGPLSSDGTNRLLPFKNEKTLSRYILPRHSEAWELYLATHYSHVDNFPQLSGDKQNVHTFLAMSFTEWSAIEIEYLRNLSKRYNA